jgi:hypothetical protein
MTKVKRTPLGEVEYPFSMDGILDMGGKKEACLRSYFVSRVDIFIALDTVPHVILDSNSQFGSQVRYRISRYLLESYIIRQSSIKIRDLLLDTGPG